MDDSRNTPPSTVLEADEVSRFADSYASFSRIVNSLQRKYIQLEEEFSAQHSELAEANQKLVRLTEHNLSVTEFLNSILNSISAGVIAVDSHGVVTHFNKAASRILGIPSGGPPGKKYRDCIPPGAPSNANALRSAERAQSVESTERVIEQDDNTRLHLSVSTAVLRNSKGEPTGAVEVFHDLTKMKRMEQEFARLNTLAVLGEMAATIAHEVRNPLSGIGGFAALLERDLGEDEQKKKLVRKIVRGVDTLNNLVTSLLNYARFDETKKEKIGFDKFLADTIEQYRREDPDRLEDVALEIRRPGEPDRGVPEVEVDRMLLRQVFFNVLNNAVEAMRDSGKIEIDYRVLPRQTAAQQYGDKMLLGLDETVLEVSVKDTGPGIEPDYVEKIFSPFFTTRSKGNGLGLAVAWKVMKAHGGDIVAGNCDTGGAHFRVLLPVKLDAANRER